MVLAIAKRGSDMQRWVDGRRSGKVIKADLADVEVLEYTEK